MFVQRAAKTLVCENLAKAPRLAMAIGKGALQAARSGVR